MPSGTGYDQLQITQPPELQRLTPAPINEKGELDVEALFPPESRNVPGFITGRPVTLPSYEFVPTTATASTVKPSGDIPAGTFKTVEEVRSALDRGEITREQAIRYTNRYFLGK